MRFRSLLATMSVASSVLHPIDDEQPSRHTQPNYSYITTEQSNTANYMRLATDMVNQFKEKTGCPGISVCVSISGNVVYSHGFGYADVENLVPVQQNTCFRIASISKSFTSLLVGRLLEQNKLNLDDDVRSLLPEFPQKLIDGKEAKITVKSLLSHTSGIRSYKKCSDKGRQTDYPEMLNTIRYKTTQDACTMFKDDALVHPPDQFYHYTTFGFTLLAAVIEQACLRHGPIFDLPKPTVRKFEEPSVPNKDKQETQNPLPKWAQFENLITNLFRFLGLNHTCLELHETIIPARAKFYMRSKDGILKNTPMVDNSYKWSGGGILSTAEDLIRMANHLSFIYMGWLDFDGILKRPTLMRLWQVGAVPPDSNWLPGLGWFLARRSGLPATEFNPNQPDRLFVVHTGGAVGGTTVLLLSLPYTTSNNSIDKSHNSLPFQDEIRRASQIGPICVAVLTNLQDVSGISQLGIALSELFLEYALYDEQSM